MTGEGYAGAIMARDGYVLLVEDNPDDEFLTRRAFDEMNLLNEVSVVRDGEEALAMLLDPAAPSPAMVLLDLKLPRVDGVEVLRQVRSNPRTRRLPVIVLTSSSEERDLVESYDLGANSFIRKPVGFSNFADTVRQLGMYWLVVNEPPPPARPADEGRMR